jgi:hypothetical protein
MEKAIGMLMVFVIVMVISLLLSLPVYWLWNGCLVGAISGVNEVTWLQAWGINILASILFKPLTVSDK